VIKVGGKIFCLMNLDKDPSVNLKCDPSLAIELREANPAIIPGYHMNKKHWNTLVLDGSLSNALIQQMIDHSYNLVLQSLPAKVKLEIEQ
jgi:predicted DNA-binding protein (MmcQ/YjbR family)